MLRRINLAFWCYSGWAFPSLFGTFASVGRKKSDEGGGLAHESLDPCQTEPLQNRGPARLLMVSFMAHLIREAFHHLGLIALAKTEIPWAVLPNRSLIRLVVVIRLCLLLFLSPIVLWPQ